MHTHRICGYTLIELLYTVVVLALLASIGLPDLGNLIERNRNQSLRDQLMAQLKHARSMAVLHNQRIEMCGSSDGHTCDDAWKSGWLIDSPSDGAIDSQHRLENRERLKWAGASTRIVFLGNGTLLKGNGRFYICRRDGRVELQLVISRQGRIRKVDGLESSQNAGTRCE